MRKDTVKTSKTNAQKNTLNNLKLKVKLNVSKKNQGRQRIELAVALLDSNDNVICEDNDFVTIG